MLARRLLSKDATLRPARGGGAAVPPRPGRQRDSVAAAVAVPMAAASSRLAPIQSRPNRSLAQDRHLTPSQAVATAVPAAAATQAAPSAAPASPGPRRAMITPAAAAAPTRLPRPGGAR